MATILGLGGVTLDRIVKIPRMPGWDETEYISDYLVQQGGMAATAMTAAARLGESVEFVGGVGDDDAGRYLLQIFKHEQVATNQVRILQKASTAFSLILVHETSGKRTIIHHRGIQAQADLNIPRLTLAGISFLHLDGYWVKLALRTAKQAKTQGITISLDPSSKLLRDPEATELFHLVDYFMPGYTFATRLTGETDPARSTEKILTYGAKAVILTKGAEGCFIRTRDTYGHLPAFQIPAVDTTGAGDTFHGAFVAGLSKGYHLRQAARFASAAAALKCTKLGGQTGIPTLPETMTFLKSRGIVIC